MLKVRERDTDADWRELGATEPFWAVLSAPRFRSENLTSDGIQAFYDSGAYDIGRIVDRLRRHTGHVPGGRALDFGCGVGRLSEAMVRHADHVTGYDISPGMLEKARERGLATYVDALPDGPFDWINSFIVFQHIPPKHGLALFERLVERLAPDGHLSVHVTIWRDARLEPPPITGWRKLVKPLVVARRARRIGEITMYDHDLTQLLRILNTHGVDDILLESIDHDGHHGVIILARRKPDVVT